MIFDNLTLIGVLFVLVYMVLLVMFRKMKSASRRSGSPVTDRFINKAIQYRHQGTALIQPAPGPCRSCA